MFFGNSLLADATIVLQKNIMAFHHDNSKSPFLSLLPLEVREIIYSYLVWPDEDSDGILAIHAGLGRSHHPARTPPWLPTICHVNEQIRIEVGLTLIREAQFELRTFACLQYFMDFLRSFPHNQGFETVKGLFVSNFWWAWNQPDQLREFITLMDMCPGLQEVRLQFEHTGLERLCASDSYWNTQKPGIMTAEEIIGRHYLREVVRLPSLRQVELVVPSQCIPLMVEVAELLKYELGGRAGKVEIVVKAQDDSMMRFVRVQGS